MGKDTLNPTTDDLLEELAGLYEKQNIPPRGSVTLAQFMERVDLQSKDQARTFLQAQIKSGLLKKVKIGNMDYYYK